MGKHFYYTVTSWVCSVHDKPAAFQVWSEGERYRHACTETCAKKQVIELTAAYADVEREGD